MVGDKVGDGVKVFVGVCVIVGVFEGVLVFVAVAVVVAVAVLVGVLVGAGVADGRVISGGKPNTRATRNCSNKPVRSACSSTIGAMVEINGIIIGWSKVTPTMTRTVPSDGSPGLSFGIKA